MHEKYEITPMDERWELSRVDIQLYKHSSQPISVQNLQVLYCKRQCKYRTNGFIHSLSTLISY